MGRDGEELKRVKEIVFHVWVVTVRLGERTSTLPVAGQAQAGCGVQVLPLLLPTFAQAPHRGEEGGGEVQARRRLRGKVRIRRNNSSRVTATFGRPDFRAFYERATPSKFA